jgi:hypothetical protein
MAAPPYCFDLTVGDAFIASVLKLRYYSNTVACQDIPISRCFSDA